ncbi:MAG: SLC13 family permease, partial [Bacteroidales bacterium]|nr:SLC13 family permease [Bacteroidales bacterium]
FLTLAFALVMFAWGRIRHDIVAFLTLFILIVAGIIEPSAAFSGFGHPAVITVASVLVIGKALEFSGLIDLLGRWVMKVGTGIPSQVFILSLLVAAASSFMNNVGALAIMMPIAVHLARKSGHPPSFVLMPIAFASLLGGMTTLIGTPSNIIIASLRVDALGEPFGMFSFTPVGVVLTITGLLFLTFIGWRLLPGRVAPRKDSDLFNIEDYITEVVVTKGSSVRGKTLREFATKPKIEMKILGLIRDNKRIHAPDPEEILKVKDLIIIEIDASQLKDLIEDTGVKLLGGKRFRNGGEGAQSVAIAEAVIMVDSILIGRSVSDIGLESKYELNLLAIAHREKQMHNRLEDIILAAGDVILVQGRERTTHDTITSLGCLPLAKRDIRLGFKPKFTMALSLFAIAIIMVVADILPVEAAFSMAAVAMVLLKILPLKEMYRSIDWSVIVLLGAMIPVGASLETSGGAAVIADAVTELGDRLPPWLIIGIIMTITMLITGLINNAATVLLMGPIAIGIANGLSYSADPFLMAVCIGGSAAFLTPIGHQSNTLVMGPGGYKFTDYTRMGLPLSIILVIIAVPLILWVFPV